MCRQPHGSSHRAHRLAGIALVSGLKRGATYSCVAIVTNGFGTTKSDKVRVTAR